jgi:hypothetical protein
MQAKVPRSSVSPTIGSAAHPVRNKKLVARALHLSEISPSDQVARERSAPA